jgi:hypothetical protein
MKKEWNQGHFLQLISQIEIMNLYRIDILKLSVKSGDKAARTANFGTIGHQMPNWEWNFTKQNNWDPN